MAGAVDLTKAGGIMVVEVETPREAGAVVVLTKVVAQLKVVVVEVEVEVQTMEEAGAEVHL